MNFWEFLDRQIGRVKPTGVAGAGVFALTAAILWIIVENKDLADNDLFKTLAQAIVVQGLIGLAMAAWFTKNSGKVEIDQPPEKPVPVVDENKGD